MKLNEKGHFEPPPRLPRHAQGVSTELAAWAGVLARTHWLLGDETVVDGADFYLGEQELGHLHLEGTAHIPQKGAVARALIAAGLAEPFRWGRDWVQYRVTSAATAQHALWLFQLRRDQLQGASERELNERIQARRPAEEHSASAG